MIEGVHLLEAPGNGCFSDAGVEANEQRHTDSDQQAPGGPQSWGLSSGVDL